MINEEVLRLLQARERGSLKYQAKCPCHEDNKESLFISWHDNGELFFHCHAGCSWRDIKTTLNYTKQMQEEGKEKDKWQLEKRYVYRDENKNALYRKNRFIPKNFSIEHYNDGKWVKGIGDSKKVLYNLPTVIEAVDKGTGVFFVEGEKDADTLSERLQIASTTIFDGAGGNIGAEILMPLNRGSVILCGDNDEPGKAFMKRLEESLSPIVKKLSKVAVPEKFKDVTDWIVAGATKDDIRKAVSSIGLVRVKGYSLDELLTMNITKRERLTGQWLLEGSSVLLAGGAGSGKSFFLHYLSSCLACGVKCLDWETKRTSVTVLDGEMAIEEIQTRLLEINSTLPYVAGVTPKLNIICKDNFLQKKQPLPNLRNVMDRMAIFDMLEVGTKVLVVDNLNIFFSGKDENTPDFWVDVEKLVSECYEREITPILVHHSPKSNPDAPSGSSKNERVAEVIIMVSKVQHGEDETGIWSNIWFRKVRHFSRDTKPFSFKVKNFSGSSYFEKHPFIEQKKEK